jgi:hypothetical protein
MSPVSDSALAAAVHDIRFAAATECLCIHVTNGRDDGGGFFSDRDFLSMPAYPRALSQTARLNINITSVVAVPK